MVRGRKRPIIPKFRTAPTQFMIAKFRFWNRLMGTSGVLRKWSQTRNRITSTQISFVPVW